MVTSGVTWSTARMLTQLSADRPLTRSIAQSRHRAPGESVHPVGRLDNAIAMTTPAINAGGTTQPAPASAGSGPPDGSYRHARRAVTPDNSVRL